MPPVDAACGEGLMPAGVRRLLGLGVVLPEDESALFHGIRYRDGAVTAEARFRDGLGIGVRRRTLHEALIERAAELGADLRWRVSATSLTDDGVQTDHGRISARWVVAADGRLSRMRKLAGIASAAPRRRRFGIRRHYAAAPWTEMVEVHWADHGEAYVTPVGPDTIGVALLTDRRPLDFDEGIGLIPELADRLRGAEIVSRDRGAGPFGQRPRRLISGRLVLVGDASGCLDPITGEGMSVAMGQARALVRAVLADDIEAYLTDHSRLVRVPRLLTGLLLVAERRPLLRRIVVRACASCPRMFSRIVDLVGRSGVELPTTRTAA
jgi:flavin-dependent dehydrogenase